MTLQLPWSDVARLPVHIIERVLVTPPEDEPITLDEAKLLAGFNWAAADVREPMLRGHIAAARSKVELDTERALLTQTWDLYLDAARGTLRLPVRPLQSVTSITSTDAAGVAHVLDPAQYLVDLPGGRIGLGINGAWPTDLRGFQPFVVRVVAGYESPADLRAAAPLLVHAVGLLTAHYATVGRDLTIVGTIVATTPHGYDDAIAAYVPVSII